MHRVDGRHFRLDTEEIREVLGGDIPLNDMAVLAWLDDYLARGLAELYGGEEQ